MVNTTSVREEATYRLTFDIHYRHLGLVRTLRILEKGSIFLGTTWHVQFGMCFLTLS